MLCIFGQENCHYFSYIDSIKLSWKSAGKFCTCLGGEMVRLSGDSSMSALSYYTLGLVAGSKVLPPNTDNQQGELKNCHNYLQCLENYQVRDYTQGELTQSLL